MVKNTNYSADQAPQADGTLTLGAEMAAYDKLPKIIRQELGHALLPYNVAEILRAYTRGFQGERPMTELQIVEQLWGVNQRNHDRLRAKIKDWPKQEVTWIVAKYTGQVTRAARRLDEMMTKRLSRRGRALTSYRLSAERPPSHTQIQLGPAEDQASTTAPPGAEPPKA